MPAWFLSGGGVSFRAPRQRKKMRMNVGVSGVFGLVLLLPGCGVEDASPGPESVEAFTRYYVNSDPDRPFSATFLGVPTWQNPCDLWVLQEIVHDVKPDLIVETGTAHGGSALFLASVLEGMGSGGRVLTIDIEPQIEQAQQHRLFQERVDVIVGDSVGEDTLAQVRERCAGRRVLVTLDSLHTADHVRKELAAYADLVSVGSYLIVQDTAIDMDPEWVERFASYDGSTAGPTPAVEEFVAARDDFVVDKDREKFLFTFHRGGFLRRVE